MASGRKGAKGNKTAHVLNLLTAPGEGLSDSAGETSGAAPVPESAQLTSGRPLLPPILEVAQANDDNLSQQIQQALEEELSPSEPEPAPAPEPPEPAPAGGKMSQDDIEKMLADMDAPAPEPPAPAPAGGKMSQDDIEKMLADMDAPTSEPPAPAPAGGKMSQDDIEKMLADMDAPAPEPPASAPAGGKMSQDDIEKMLADMDAPAPEPPAPTPAGSKMSQDDIKKMLADMDAPAPEPPAPTPAGGKMSQDDIEKMLADMDASASEPPVLSPETSSQFSSSADDDLSYVNIMQTLVEEKAPRYIKMFGLCTCKHCEADVKALTLTNLVPKYVVLSKQDRIPMLTVYEGRFNSTVFAQLTRACKIVMEHPHHGR